MHIYEQLNYFAIEQKVTKEFKVQNITTKDTVRIINLKDFTSSSYKEGIKLRSSISGGFPDEPQG